MRIFVGPVEIAGVALGIREGMQAIGERADLVLNHDNRFNYGGTESSPWPGRVWTRLGNSAMRAGGGGMERAFFWFLWKLWSFAVLAWALPRYRAFIFVFGNTITNTAAEVWLLKLLRKKMIFYHLGSDVRPSYIDGPKCHEEIDLGTRKLARIAYKVSRRVWRHEQAGLCVTLPFTAHFHRRKYINSFFFGLPRVMTEHGPVPAAERPPGSPVRILHSPSHAAIKGSREIELAIEALRAKGHAIEFIKLENATNAEVVAQIQSCGFIVDQVYSDMPMATFATEAAYYGKPAVVCGYAATQMHEAAGWPVPPTLFVHPNELKRAIETLVTDEPARVELGRRARDFVRSQWSPAAVAERLLRIIRDDIPEEWWSEPGAVFYAQGCGLSEDRCRRVIAGLLREFGPAALRLESGLEAFFVDFAAAPAAGADR